MKVYLIVAIACITLIVVVSTIKGFDTYLATGGVGAIVGLCTWRATRTVERRKQADQVVAEALRKAGYGDTLIERVTKTLKEG